MSSTLVECVPNFSEGRDRAKIDLIAGAIRSAGVAVLDIQADADHNRCVVTFAGPAERVAEAAFRGVAKAVELIDLRRHTGVHPRIGVADVVPFVPIQGVTLKDCALIAQQVGRRVWEELGVPVYLYEAAARRPERVNLENIRRGQFEGLREEAPINPERRPDIGGPELHPSAGATVMGARKFLIAYNINLATPDVDVARRIARVVRFSSGGLRAVKAMGVPLESRNQAQVSMNLTDFEETPIHRVFEAVRSEAERNGVSVASSEIVGLVPKKALEMAAEWFLKVENFSPGMVLENRLAETAAPCALEMFTECVTAPAAAAAAGALAAGLAVAVSKAEGLPAEIFADYREAFAAAAARAPISPQAVEAADEATRDAILGALEVAERAERLTDLLAELAASVPARHSPDIITALALSSAAMRSAVAGVRFFLASNAGLPWASDAEERLGRLRPL